eukprot:6458634-Amphidinium_carterae.1
MAGGVACPHQLRSILGATVLAWGNCVGDLVADTALVRKGKAKMAVAGVFGSPLMSEVLKCSDASRYDPLEPTHQNI